jgi:hypothetical protein
MKKLLIISVVILAFPTLAWGEPPVRQVEVVNEYLNVNVENPTLDVNLLNHPVATNVMNWPDVQDVRVINQSEFVQYEYFLLDTWDASDFQAQLNAKAADGYELNFFTSYAVGGGIYDKHYVGVMRRPVPPE